MVNKRALGSKKEIIAADYLTGIGYKLIQMNFHSRTGEIDIIAMDDEYLVFCEVKYRKNSNLGHPFDSVDYRKQQRIINTARYYMLVNGISENQSIRFDVVGILGSEISHIKNAF